MDSFLCLRKGRCLVCVCSLRLHPLHVYSEMWRATVTPCCCLREEFLLSSLPSLGYTFYFYLNAVSGAHPSSFWTGRNYISGSNGGLWQRYFSAVASAVSWFRSTRAGTARVGEEGTENRETWLLSLGQGAAELPHRLFWWVLCVCVFFVEFFCLFVFCFGSSYLSHKMSWGTSW